MSEFVPFPVPIHRDDIPLVQRDGATYRCTGCGGEILDGAWLHETVEDGMVVGLTARHGPDGEVYHQCGKGSLDG